MHTIFTEPVSLKETVLICSDILLTPNRNKTVNYDGRSLGTVAASFEFLPGDIEYAIKCLLY